MLSQDQVSSIRKDFPYLELSLAGKSLIYLDNGATTQKPRQIIEALSDYYAYNNANPHRGAHYLANQATEAYEASRMATARFIHAYRAKEIIFTRNTTEAFNLLAYSLGLSTLKSGDEVVISILEHHANLLPWQFVCQQTGAQLKYIYVNPADMQLTAEAVERVVTEKTKILSLTACSNVTGTRAAMSELFAIGKKVGAICICDLAQLAPHAKVDIRELGCDFAAFSAHKMYAAMGLGVLWGRYELLAQLRPFLLGGDMIEHVYEQSATFLAPASRFEAGTMNVGAAVTLKRAIEYLEDIGLAEIDAYEQALAEYAISRLKELPDIELYHCATDTKNTERGAVVPFNVRDVHPHDVASILDNYGIAIRAGHHCAEPLHQYLGLNATCRASFGFYNTFAEIDQLVEALPQVRKTMGLS